MVLSSVCWMDPLSCLEVLDIEELCVVNGADRLFSCLYEPFPDLERHDRIGESLDDVFRLKDDKGERTAAYTGRCRELFEKATRQGIELPDVAWLLDVAWCALGSGTQGYRSDSCRTVVHGAKRCIGHFRKDCPERLQKKPVSQAKVLVTRDDLSARRQIKTLDELLLEIEKLPQESVSHVSVEPEDEEETCLLLREPGKAIIDTVDDVLLRH